MMDYKSELDEDMIRKQIYEDNTYKSYTLSWEKWNTEMKKNCIKIGLG